MARPPRWNDPIGSACDEAEVALRRGLMVRPTLYGFEDGEPTLRVQPGWNTLHARRDQVHSMLVALVPALGIRQLLVFSHARITDPSIGDVYLRDALATYGIAVEVAERRGDQVTTRAHLLERRRTGDDPDWAEADPAGDGMWTAVLRQALTLEGAAYDDTTPMGLAYAMSRWGSVVEVAPGWHERYGFSTPPRRLEHLVRSGDRRRARNLVRAGRTAAATSGRSAAR
ncbi:MAG TPA: hypothetical protein VK906_11460 [Egicoccus sp.]|nr:hypothetical protein [Egicoccus sp.]HSK23789.1 hypothetical protein [Egicoccus sp.]